MQAPVTIQCTACGARLGATSDVVSANRAVRCPKCQQVFRAGERNGAPALAGAYQTFAPPTPAPPPQQGVIPCPHCTREMAFDPRLASRTVACPHCQGQLQMPAVNDPPLEPSSPLPARPDRHLRSAKRRPARGRGKFWLVLGGIGGLAVVACVVLLWILLRSRSLGLVDETAYFPDDCQVVASVDVQGILASQAGKTFLASELYKQLSKEVAQGMQGRDLEQAYELHTGLRLQDLSRCTFAGNMRGEDMVVILKTRNAKNFRPTERGQRMQFLEEKVDKHVVYHTGQGNRMAYCVPDDYTVVFAPEFEILRRIFNRKGPATLSTGLQSALMRVDFTQSVGVAIDFAGANRAMARDMDMQGFFDAVDGMTMHCKAAADVSWEISLLAKDTGRPVISGKISVDPEFVCNWLGKWIDLDRRQRERWREEDRKFEWKKGDFEGKKW